MLKLPTSLFECICFICVNIVSFSSLWDFFSPALFIAIFTRPNLEQTKTKKSKMFQKKNSNEVCVSTLMYFSILLPHYSLFYGLFFPEFYFSIYIFNIAVPGRGQIHHLAPVLKPWKSKLCLWITIHQNKFPLHPPHEALITEESLFYL